MNESTRTCHPPLFSIGEVLKLERMAWNFAHEAVTFHFDGIHIWRRGFDTHLVTWWDAPADGWCHGTECSCSTCSSYRSGL